MIKLIVNPESDKIQRTFTKNEIIIGSGKPEPSDLTLQGENLETIHVKIIKQENRCYAINQANDPFVTLNGLPFGKKNIKNHDRLQIGNTIVMLEFDQTQVDENASLGPGAMPPKQIKISSEEELNQILEQALSKKRDETTNDSVIPTNISNEIPPPSFLDQEGDDGLEKDFDLEAELEKLEVLAENFQKEEAWNNEKVDIEDILGEVEDLGLNEPVNPEENSSPIQQPHSEVFPKEKENVYPAAEQYQTPLPKKERQSLKDFYLIDLDDEKQTWNKSRQENPKKESRWNWKLFGFIVGLLLFLLIAAGALFYYNISVRTNAEEMKMAEGAADVAMALTYAQVNHNKPPNQNWSDPEFLKNSLMNVIGPEYVVGTTSDVLTQFNNNTYLIRIYTSSDLSQFLVIAQPAHSLLQWLIPRASIIIDSKEMQLRRTEDLKALNRLVLNPNTLEGPSAAEVSSIVKQAELIPLSALNSKFEGQGFKPPKALALLRKGAENLIYNAPRYHRFGGNFVKKALMIADNQDESHEIAQLRQEMQALTKYPNLVLYSTQGIQGAAQAQKALNTFLPNNKLLIAYIKFNSKGSETSSHLFMDEGQTSDIALAEAPELYEKKSLSKIDGKENPEEIFKQTEAPIDNRHPLFLQLCSLKTMREQAHTVAENQMKDILNVPNRREIIAFLDRLQSMMKKYENETGEASEIQDKNEAIVDFLKKLSSALSSRESLDREQEDKHIGLLFKLYQQNADMPFNQFMAYIKASGLEPFVQEKLIPERNQDPAQLPIEDLIHEKIKNIGYAHGWEELNQKVLDVSNHLTLEQLPDLKKLIALQTEARGQVLEKLDDFLLSNDKGLSPSEFNEENRPLLANIMKNAWIVDPDQLNFYMNEYLLRINQNK